MVELNVLGVEISWGAHYSCGDMGVEVAVEGLGQAEIGYLGLEVAPVQEDVGRLHIPVDQGRLACLVQLARKP